MAGVRKVFGKRAAEDLAERIARGPLTDAERALAVRPERIALHIQIDESDKPL